MPNALDVSEQEDERILLRGSLGTGKTTQFLTLPGKKFLYVFERSALTAIRGHDVEFKEFIADRLNFTVKPIPKGQKMGEGTLSPTSRMKAQAFAQWEKHFSDSLDNGFFDQFDVIGLDSITSLCDIGMDDILARDGRLEYTPALSDYNVLKTQIARILRSLCALKKTLFVTAHTMYRQNEASKKLLNEILIPGDLQVRGPLLFSSVFQTYYNVTAGGKTFMVQSVIDNHNENLKTDIPNMMMKQDVTIKDFRYPERFGIGKFIVDARKLHASRAEANIKKREETLMKQD